MMITFKGLLKALGKIILAILGIIAVTFYWIMFLKAGGIL